MKHRRRSIRIPGYDYASAGWYFVTVCCKDRAHLFGEVCQGQMVLNEAGYYEHIIRNQESYRKIAAYIRNNPAQSRQPARR
jgi:REP element-mobilizing transposase RayT